MFPAKVIDPSAATVYLIVVRAKEPTWSLTLKEIASLGETRVEISWELALSLQV